MLSENSNDVVERVTRLYREKLQASLERTHWNDFVAIEPDSGTYYCGKTLSEAIQAARAADPQRLVYALRVGQDAAVLIGVMGT